MDRKQRKEEAAGSFFLDLSAAFDTLSKDIFVSKLDNCMVLTKKAETGSKAI